MPEPKNLAEQEVGRVVNYVAMPQSDWDTIIQVGFTDGTHIRIKDVYQGCCESRYFRTDDQLDQINGGTLIGVEVRDIEGGYDETEDTVYEVQFLLIRTSKGDLTFSAHNDHNGYYGGINVRVLRE